MVMTMQQYAIVEDGAVINAVLWNGDESQWSAPAGAEAIALDDGSPVGIGWRYVNGVFAAPPAPVPEPLAPEQILANNTAARNARLDEAALHIAPLQDAVDLGIATSGETANLTAWKQYRVALNRLDLSISTVQWPVAPA